ncbi:hypothetical protein MLD38_025457 [Melastoma candidum]|uniref:Uncharacterized protein n=1 Tax=Melastoma candidum TaxID=119954 RepID=A0ACB9NYY2_9MYRT|nr:hypothetical protein MLD38_025457 [Melastoma candidum]
MPVISSSFLHLRHRFAPTLHSHHLFPIARHRNPNNLSSRRQTNPTPKPHSINKILHSSTLSSTLPSDHVPTLSSSQAIGTVAASQANFMRVIVQPHNFRHEPEEQSPSIGVELLCVVKAVLKKIGRKVVVGDRVVVGSIDWVDRRGMIENVFERKAVMWDPPIANVDHLLVLFSMDQPKLEPFLLTRFLVEAESTGIPLTLALNKAELVDEESLASWKSRLRKWGYEPMFCSIESGLGLGALAFSLRGQTTVIVGPSGVGKSSLINALRNNSAAPDLTKADDNWFEPILGSKWFEDQRVGEVSSRSGRGKHTTRHVSLLPLVGGGFLADTPGFNQPSLLKVTKQSLADAFPEIRKKLEESQPATCAFNNCLHLGEPGCLLEGESLERYPYYFQLLDEIRVREEFQLRTFGTKKESDVRYKVGGGGIQQAEPRLEPKKHRRQSRKTINQSILDELDKLDDDDEILLEDENDPVLRALRNESRDPKLTTWCDAPVVDDGKGSAYEKAMKAYER